MLSFISVSKIMGVCISASISANHVCVVLCQMFSVMQVIAQQMFLPFTAGLQGMMKLSCQKGFVLNFMQFV